MSGKSRGGFQTLPYIKPSPTFSDARMRGEKRQDGEDLQSPQEHADCEYEAAQGVDYLEALCGAYLPQSGTYVVQGC